MSDPNQHNQEAWPSAAKKPEKDPELEKLRHLLLKPEQIELAELKERLNDPKLRTEEVSRILSEALVQRSRQDASLSKVLSPLIEEGIKVSIKKDPRALVSAIFPLIGPAIRKAISETFAKMVQSLNQALEHSLSFQGLKWRLEAYRTGKSFAEVVILHNLVYRVEQIFLIHRETGLLLHHVVAEQVTYQDADMVSGMLTAIQDFVHDSFNSNSHGELRTMQVGELVVWVESSPDLLLAGVIRGNPSEDLRQIFQDTLESIQLEMVNEIEAYKGNSEPFEKVKPYLQDCLQVQLEKKRRKSMPLFPIFAGATVIIIAILIFFVIRNNKRWSNFVDQLNAQKGIVITQVDKDHGKRVLTGLRDPLAAKPENILKNTKINPNKVIFAFEPYQAIDPDFILMRLQRSLNPQQKLHIGIENEIIKGSGFTSLTWIDKFQSLIPTLSGLAGFNLEVILIGDDLEPIVFTFDKGSSEIRFDRYEEIDDFIRHLKNVYQNAIDTGEKFKLDISGHSSTEGSEDINRKISQERSEAFKALLVSRGLNGSYIYTRGVGSSKPIVIEKSEEDKQTNRSVSFKLYLSTAHEEKDSE